LRALNEKPFLTLEQEDAIAEAGRRGFAMGQAIRRNLDRKIEEIFYNENPFSIL